MLDFIKKRLTLAMCAVLLCMVVGLTTMGWPYPDNLFAVFDFVSSLRFSYLTAHTVVCLLRILVATLLFYAGLVGLLFALNFPVWASVRRLLPRLLNQNNQWGVVKGAILLLINIPLGVGVLACEVWRQVPSALASFSADQPPHTLMAALQRSLSCLFSPVFQSKQVADWVTFGLVINYLSTYIFAYTRVGSAAYFMNFFLLFTGTLNEFPTLYVVATVTYVSALSSAFIVVLAAQAPYSSNLMSEFLGGAVYDRFVGPNRGWSLLSTLGLILLLATVASVTAMFIDYKICSWRVSEYVASCLSKNESLDLQTYASAASAMLPKTFTEEGIFPLTAWFNQVKKE